jgi:large conductance mechanosensitive channel
VVIGSAFTAVVTGVVADLITPIIGAVGGGQNFSSMHFTINGSAFLYGDFINKIITFLVVSAVIFFLVITPLNALVASRRAPAAPATKKCAECLSDIPIDARRCAFCTSVVAQA